MNRAIYERLNTSNSMKWRAPRKDGAGILTKLTKLCTDQIE